jgi:hypothetical protein
MGQTEALLYQLIEDAMAKPPTPYVKPKVRVKAQGIPMAGVLVRTDDTGKHRIVKKDTAPPHVRAGRRRKANKVTGARAAK